MNWNVISAAEMPSTQIPAKAAARAGAPHGTVFVTDYQNSGRGRRDRVWQAVPGRDLTFSALLRPQIPVSSAHLLTLAASLAVADLGERLLGTGAGIGIKWPNDVLIGDRKLCGIICEASGIERLDYAVVGIGINVNRTEAELVDSGSPDRPNPASLKAFSGSDYELPELLAALLPLFDRRIVLLERSGFSSFREEYRARCATLGRSVRVITDEGEYFGRAADIGDRGELLLELDGRLMSFDAADVVHASLEAQVPNLGVPPQTPLGTRSPDPGL